MYFNPTTNRFEQQGRTGDINQFSNLNNLSALTSNRQEITVLNFEAGDKLNLALDQASTTVAGSSVKSFYRVYNSNGEVILLRKILTCTYGLCPDIPINTILPEYSDIRIVSGVNYATRVTQDAINRKDQDIVNLRNY